MSAGQGGQSTEKDAPERSSYVRFEGMTWPHPADPNDVQWRLRYGQPSKGDMLVAASFMHAYGYLFGLPQRERNRRIEQVKAHIIPSNPTEGGAS